MKYPIRNAAAIDVDDTLLINGEANDDLVEWIKRKKEEGTELVLWSARGRAYAQEVAEKLKVSHLFDAIISKPSVIVDDKGWGWIKWTRVIQI